MDSKQLIERVARGDNPRDVVETAFRDPQAVKEKMVKIARKFGGDPDWDWMHKPVLDISFGTEKEMKDFISHCRYLWGEKVLDGLGKPRKVFGHMWGITWDSRE